MNPIPTTSIVNNSQVLLNSQFNVDFTFQNLSGTIGFKPFIDVLLPHGITTSDAISIGYWDMNNSMWKNNSDQEIVKHPYDSSVSLPSDPEGNCRWYYFVSHYSSYGHDQPEIIVKSITCQVSESDGATLGNALTIKAVPWFRYGKDAEDNPIEDPPIQGTLISSTVTPTLIILNKNHNLPESETTTGVNFPFKFTITVDIAENQLIENLIIQDDLPDTLKYVSNSTVSNVSYISENIINNIQNGSITWDYGSVTGNGGTDITLEYNVYVPLKDSSDQYILNQSTGTNLLVDTTCTTTYDNGDNTGLQSINNNQFVVKSIAIQKNDTIVSNYIIPGDNITYTKNIQISDYFGFDTLSITDILSDGQIFNDDVTFQIKTGQHTSYQTYNKSSFTSNQVSHINSLNGSNEITQVQITINVSNIVSDLIHNNVGLLLGGCTRLGETIDENSYNVGATTMTIVYTAQLNTHYGNESAEFKEIDIGDSVSSSITISGNNYDFLSETSHNETVNDTSATWTGVGRVTINKSIYAVNGNIGYQTDIYPGDLVTYRVLVNMSHQNVQDMILTDYLPPPIMSSTDIINTNQLQSYPGSPSTPPPVNGIQYGPSDTFHNFQNPAITTSSTSNSIKLTFGTYQSRIGLGEQIIDILYTLEASDDPVADGLKLTNQVVIDINNTKNNPIQKLDYTELTINEPHMYIEKGVVVSSTGLLSSSLPNGLSFSGINSEQFSGNINNTITLNADSTGNKANGYIKYCIVVKNSGHYEGFDVLVKDIHESGITVTSTPYVTDGEGNEIVVLNASNLFTESGVSLGSLTRYNDDSTQTSNIIVITYDVHISPTVNLDKEITNTTTLVNYSNKLNGTNFSNGSKKATRYITTDGLTVTKEITAVSENLPLNNPEDNINKYVTIGENINFKSIVTIPQGTAPSLIVREETSTKSSGSYSGFSLNLSSIVIILDEFLTADTHNPSSVSASNGRYHDFDFGNVVNSSGGNQTITIEYEQMATDNSKLIEGYVSKSRTYCYYNESSSSTSNQTKVNIKEPSLTVTKTLALPTPPYPSKGSYIYYQIDIDSNSSPVRAKALAFKDTIPDYLSLITTLPSDVDGNPVTVINKDIIYGMDNFDINQSHSLNIQCQVDEYIAASRVVNGANLTYKSVDTEHGRNYQDVGWRYFETRPSTTLEIENITHDHGTINGNITGAIGDEIKAIMKMFIPKGTTYFKDIKLYFNSYLSIGFSPYSIIPTFGPGDHSITFNEPDLSTTPTSNGNYIRFPFNKNIYNNRVSTDGNLDDYVQLVFSFKIKNTYSNQNNNVIDVNHIFTCTNLAGNDEGIVSNVKSYHIVEPKLVITKTLTKLPKNGNDIIQYKIDINNELSSRSTAYDIEITDTLPDEVSANGINITLPFGFTDLSSGKSLSFTRGSMSTSDTYTIYIDCSLSNVSLFTKVANTLIMKWKSQQVSTDETRVGVENDNVDDYISISEYSFVYEPMIISEPGINQTFSVLFEDALDFDFDYEDLVLEGRQIVYKDIYGIHFLEIEFNLMSRGAAYKHAFGVYINGISDQTGSWNVRTLINGETLEDPTSIIRSYMGIPDNSLSLLLDDRIPLFVDTRKYLQPDDIGYPFSSNVNDRTIETPDWIFPSSVKCLIKFTSPYMKTDVKILPYIDVWGNQDITSYTQKQYRITLGDIVEYSQKEFTNYPRAFITNGTFLTGTDYDYGLKDVYPLFSAWVETSPDYTDIITHSKSKHSWRNVVSSSYKPVKILRDEYTGLNVNDRLINKPLPKLFNKCKSMLFPRSLCVSGSVRQSGVVENSLTSYTDIISLVTLNNHFYCLREDGTVVGTSNLGDTLSNIIQICPGINNLFGINSSMNAISTDNELDLSQLTGIYDLVIIGSSEMIVGLKEDNTVIIDGTGHNPNVSGWSDIVKISGSSNYLMALDCDGNVFLTDMSGNQETLWSDETIVDISAGVSHCLGLTKEMTIVQYNQNVPAISGLEGIVYINAGNSYSITMDQMGLVYYDGTLPNDIDLSDFNGSLRPVINNQTMMAISYS